MAFRRCYAPCTTPWQPTLRRLHGPGVAELLDDVLEIQLVFFVFLGQLRPHLQCGSLHRLGPG